VQYVINPNDEFGLTRAIWFQEQQGATVTVKMLADQTRL
jgi:electron transfer flavoprotein beta subunit